MFIIDLTGAMDNMLGASFDTEAGVGAFIRENLPFPVEGGDVATTGPIAEAFAAAPCGPGHSLGFRVTKFVNGRPVDYWYRRRIDEGWPGPKEYASLSENDQAKLHQNEQTDPWPAPVLPTAPVTAPQEEWDADLGEAGA